MAKFFSILMLIFAMNAQAQVSDEEKQRAVAALYFPFRVIVTADYCNINLDPEKTYQLILSFYKNATPEVIKSAQGEVTQKVVNELIASQFIIVKGDKPILSEYAKANTCPKMRDLSSSLVLMDRKNEVIEKMAIFQNLVLNKCSIKTISDAEMLKDMKSILSGSSATTKKQDEDYIDFRNDNIKKIELVYSKSCSELAVIAKNNGYSK